MDLFTDRMKLNPEKFPEFSKRKNMFVNTEKGENEMCEKVDQLARQREQEAVLMTLFRGVEAGGVKVTFAAKEANLSLNEFKDQMRLRGFSVPHRKGRSSTVKKA